MMGHEHNTERLMLMLYGELDTKERMVLEEHVATCPSCREELEELRTFHATVASHNPAPLSDDMVYQARQQLRMALRKEHARLSLVARTAAIVEKLVASPARIALGGAAMLVFGVFIGYIAFGPAKESSGSFAERSAIWNEGETRITNVRFRDSDASDGQVEFTFDASTPITMKGNIDDDRVQKVLAHALLNDDNPGVRLRSVNAFASQALSVKQPDPEVKAALLSALRSDENPGVRNEALRVLRGYPFDDQIKEAFLYALIHDTNAGVRIAAINSLDSLHSAQSVDQHLATVLREKMQSDDNNYVRMRAKAVLQEVKEQ